MNFVHGIIQFLSSGEVLEGLKYPDFVFAIGSGVMGVLLIILDCIAFIMLKKSFFGLNYSGVIKSLGMIFLWGISSTIGGYIAMVASMLQFNRLGCLAAGFAGPLILPRVNSLLKSQEDDQTITEEEPEQ